MPDVAYQAWATFAATHAFKAGEHVTAIGRTGRGKTTLISHGVLPHYPFCVYLATKRADPSAYPYLARHGFKITKSPKLSATHQPKVIYRPGPFGIGKADKQLLGDRMRAILEVAYLQAQHTAAKSNVERPVSWAINADEFAFLADLGLEEEFETIYRTGRGLGLTMIANVQNPVGVPRTAYDQITHLFLWRQTERDRLRRIAEIAGDVGEQVMAALPYLPEYDALYVNTDTGELVRTRYPL